MIASEPSTSCVASNVVHVNHLVWKLMALTKIFVCVCQHSTLSVLSQTIRWPSKWAWHNYNVWTQPLHCFSGSVGTRAMALKTDGCEFHILASKVFTDCNNQTRFHIFSTSNALLLRHTCVLNEWPRREVFHHIHLQQLGLPLSPIDTSQS